MNLQISRKKKHFIFRVSAMVLMLGMFLACGKDSLPDKLGKPQSKSKQQVQQAGATGTGNALELTQIDSNQEFRSFVAELSPCGVNDCDSLLHLQGTAGSGFLPAEPGEPAESKIVPNPEDTTPSAEEAGPSAAETSSGLGENPIQRMVPQKSSGNTSSLNGRYFDQDLDGYGTGAPAGPDWDDFDPNVNGSAPAELLDNILKTRGVDSPNSIHFISAGSSGEENSLAQKLKSLADNLKAGDVLIFHQGVYNLPDFPVWQISGTADAPVFFMNYPGETVIFRGRGSLRFENSKHLHLHGLSFSATGTEDQAALRIQNSSDVEITHSLFENIYGDAISISKSNQIQIRHSVFRQIKSRGVFFNNPQGRLELTNNLVYANKVGFELNGANLHINKCIIHNNQTGGIKISAAPDTLELGHNLVLRNGSPQLYIANDDISSSSNLSHWDVYKNTFWIHPEDTTQKALWEMKSSALITGSLNGNIFSGNQAPVFRFESPEKLNGLLITQNIFYNSGTAFWSFKKATKDKETSFSSTEIPRVLQGWQNNVFRNPGFRSISSQP